MVHRAGHAGDEDEHGNIQGGTTLMSAIKTIIIADLVMSFDNVIAIAGAANQADPDHQLGLVIFGLLVSIGDNIEHRFFGRFLVRLVEMQQDFCPGLLGDACGCAPYCLKIHDVTPLLG